MNYPRFSWQPTREYPAIVEKVIDGDTVKFTFDMGMGIYHKETVRLYGINALELIGKSHDDGVAAREFVQRFLKIGTEVKVKTYKDRKDKYGRYLAVVWFDGNNLNDLMVANGHAVSYLVKRERK